MLKLVVFAGWHTMVAVEGSCFHLFYDSLIKEARKERVDRQRPRIFIKIKYFRLQFSIAGAREMGGSMNVNELTQTYVNNALKETLKFCFCNPFHEIFAYLLPVSERQQMLKTKTVF